MVAINQTSKSSIIKFSFEKQNLYNGIIYYCKTAMAVVNSLGFVMITYIFIFVDTFSKQFHLA